MRFALTGIYLLPGGANGHVHAITDPGHDHGTDNLSHVVVEPKEGHTHRVIDHGHIHPEEEPGAAITGVYLEATLGHTHELKEYGHRHDRDDD